MDETREVLETGQLLALQGGQAPGSAEEALFHLRGDIVNRLRVIEDRLDVLVALVGLNQSILTEIRGTPELVVSSGDSALAATHGDRFGGFNNPGPIATSGSSDRLQTFNLAIEQLRRQNTQAARNGFEKFVDEYPNDRLVPQARMRLAELFAYDNALLAATGQYVTLAKTFPRSDEAPEALYRAGLLFLELGDVEGARDSLRLLVTHYARHQLTPLARVHLSDIPGGRC